MVSHPHQDHIAELPKVLDLFNVKRRYSNPATPDRLVYSSGKKDLKEPHKTWAHINETWTGKVSPENSFTNHDSYGGVQFNTYYCKEAHLEGSAAENLNNYSILTTVEYSGLKIVFPGDLEPDGWDAVMDNNANLENDLAQGSYRILVAPHHGRKSGVRRGEKVYTRFLEAMMPDLVIISDKYGNDSTDPEAYRGWAGGMNVLMGDKWEKKEVLTTKTNDCVSIQIEGKTLTVKVF